MGFSPDSELWTVTQVTQRCDSALYANAVMLFFQAAIMLRQPPRYAGA